MLYGPTCNLIVKSEVFKSISFNETFKTAACEDIFFCFEAIQIGFDIRYSNNLAIEHDFGYSGCTKIEKLRLFYRMFKKYGEGEQLLIRFVPNYYDYLLKTQEITST